MNFEQQRITPPSTIAIDGPAASGKTTIGQMLAQRLGYLFLDTGCMYRAVTQAALKRQIDTSDEKAVVQLAHDLDIQIDQVDEPIEGHYYRVTIDGTDVTRELRTQAVDQHVSEVSAYLQVREEMVRQQHAYGQRGQAVMVGRDIGTVVLPDAPLKFYMTASPEERAKRRWEERQKRGSDVSYEAILADVIRRDKIDSGRLHSPLRPAEDAIIIDTSGRSPETVIEEILTIIHSSQLTIDN